MLLSFITSGRVPCSTTILHVSFVKIVLFFLLGPTNNFFHAADVQRDPVIPSSALLSPPVSSPCLDANEGIVLRETGSSGCLTLKLCQTNQMWKGEPLKLPVAKSYWKVVGAKLLRVVDDTFYLILTDGTDCCYLDRLTSWASTVRCKPKKKKDPAIVCRPPFR